jgi:hypothetical protein
MSQAHQKPKIGTEVALLFSIPTEILEFVFSFLVPIELCVLDSAILNHKTRPHFLTALQRRFHKKSLFDTDDLDSLDSQALWYLSRRIPITDLVLRGIFPEGIVSTNSYSLIEFTVIETDLSQECLAALQQCVNISKVHLENCNTKFEIGFFLRNLAHLRELHLHQFTLSKTAIDILSTSCRYLKCLTLLYVDGVGDAELRSLLQGCPALCSLKFCSLEITNESVQMLVNYQPQIPSIGICDCDRVNLENVLTLLEEITIPTIFSNKNEMLRRSALQALVFSLPYLYSEPHRQVIRLLSHKSLLKRLVELVSLNNSVRDDVFSLFTAMLDRGYLHPVVDSGIIPAIIRHFDSFHEIEQMRVVSILATISAEVQYRHIVLSSGVLSIFRSRLIQGNLLKPNLEFQLKYLTILTSLSSLISHSVVPVEDWINIVPFLIQDDRHLVIHFICLACISPSHVRSLVDQGILGYWDRVLLDPFAAVLEDICYLTSIDDRLDLRVQYDGR